MLADPVHRAELGSVARGQPAGTVDPRRVEFYTWLQWIFDEQLEHVQRELLRAGMKIGVIQDLAIGVHPFGADTWAMGTC